MEREPLFARPTEQVLRAAIAWMVAVYAINFFFLGFVIGPYDYDHLSAYYDLAWRFWQTSSLPPQYNPYLCGGRTLGGDPQLPIFHPLILLVPILGPTLTIKWEMLAQLALGAWGLIGILKYWNVSREGKLWGVFLFLAGGGLVSRFLVGHVTMGFFALYPLFIWLSYRLESEPKKARLFFGYLALFFYAGMYKPNFLIYGVPGLFIEVTVRSALKKDFRPFLYFVLATGLSGVLNAVTYLPSWKYFSDFPRLDGSEPRYIPLYAFFANVLLPLKAIPERLYGSGFLMRHEYNHCLGPVALMFCFLAWKKPWTERRAEKIAFVALAVSSIVLGMGATTNSLSLFPYTWFHAVWPGFKSIRVPVRLWFGAYLALLVFSALGFRAVSSRAKWAAWLALGVLPLLLSSTVNLFKTSVQKEQLQWSVSREYPEALVLSHTDHPSHAYRWTRKGIGIIDCVDNIEIKKSPKLQERGTLALLDSQTSKAKWNGWSEIDVAAAGNGNYQLTFNLNHSPYWHFYPETSARVVSRWGDLLTLEAREPRIAGKLVFEQPLSKEAMWISLWSTLGFVLIGAYLYWRNFNDRETARRTNEV